MKFKRLISFIIVISLIVLNTNAYANINDGNIDDIHKKTYLEDLTPIESDRYTGNEGDSFIDKIGRRNGNTDVQGIYWEHGLTAWVARWNYTSEVSWVWNAYELSQNYNILTGNIVLIDSYNEDNFRTAIEIIGDGKILYNCILTPDILPIMNFNINVAGVDVLKIYLHDLDSVSGGTAFGLSDLCLYKTTNMVKNNIKVIFNSKELSFEQPPYRAEDGSVMVPLRTAFEAMGANVYWNDQYKAAFVEYGSKGIIFTHDKLTFYIVSKNGNELSCHTETLDTPVVEHNGRTFIPLRNLAESIGCNVDWDNDTQTASVSIDINNKGKDFSAYEFEKINALYYAIVNTDPFKEYTDEIFSILKGRNVLVDSIAFSWTDITYGIKKFLGLSFDDESMYEEYARMCLNKVLAKVPNGASEAVDTDIITFLQDKVTDGVSIATEYFGASSTETKLLESTIDKMGKVIDWSAFTVEQIDKLMKDYGNNIAYLKVLQDNCNDDEYLGIIYSLMGDYTDKWYRSVLDLNNKLVDDAFDMGLDVGVGFYTVGLYPIADFAKDIVNKSIGLDKKTDAITDLYSVCYLLPLFKNSYSSTRSNLMNGSSAFEDFRAAFEINKAADIYAYECIKDFASSKEDTDIADERYKALKNMSYMLWKAQ